MRTASPRIGTDEKDGDDGNDGNDGNDTAAVALSTEPTACTTNSVVLGVTGFIIVVGLGLGLGRCVERIAERRNDATVH